MLLYEGSDYAMRKYNVTEIAKLLNVSDETVRRWIRSGALRSTKTSNKIGNAIDEQDLFEFVQTKPKYRKMLGSPETCLDDTISEELNDLLIDLIIERDKLTNHINKIQALLKKP
jgi:excisionase family DNA binding protein